MLVQQARTVLLDRNNNNFLHPQRTHKQLSCLVQVDLLVRRDPHPRVRVVHTQWPRLTSNSSSTTSSLLRRTHSSHPWRHSSSLEVPVCSVRWLPPLLVSLLDLPSATVCLTCSSVAAALHPPNRLSSRLKRTTRVPTPDSSRRWALAASSKARISSSVLKAVRSSPPPFTHSFTSRISTGLGILTKLPPSFLFSTRTANDMNSCSYYLEQLKACQAAARPY